MIKMISHMWITNTHTHTTHTQWTFHLLTPVNNCKKVIKVYYYYYLYCVCSLFCPRVSALLYTTTKNVNIFQTWNNHILKNNNNITHMMTSSLLLESYNVEFCHAVLKNTILDNNTLWIEGQIPLGGFLTLVTK